LPLLYSSVPEIDLPYVAGLIFRPIFVYTI
jgi:hypothetical protein